MVSPPEIASRTAMICADHRGTNRRARLITAPSDTCLLMAPRNTSFAKDCGDGKHQHWSQGTKAVRTPAAPMTPTNHGSNVCRLNFRSAKSISLPVNPGMTRMTAKPENSANSKIN